MPRRPAVRTADDRRTTIRDVAAKAGVSVATVSRVLAGNYPTAPATRARVMRAARDLDYVANAHARALAGVSAKTVGVLVSHLSSPFCAYVAQGVEQQAAREGRLCMVCTTGADADRELTFVRLLREQRADAVILVGGVVETDEYRTRMARYAQGLAAAGSRLVLCGRPGLGDNVPAMVVDYDNEGGAYAATSHLFSAGHERILFLGGTAGLTSSRARLDGWRRAHLDRGREPDPGLVEADGAGEAYGHDTVRRRVARHGGRPDFTAIFAYQDSIAAGAMLALRELGVLLPNEVSVVGYDDLPFAAHLTPALTTVHVPAEELGRTAVRMALHAGEFRSGSHQPVVLGTHVVVRESVAHRP